MPAILAVQIDTSMIVFNVVKVCKPILSSIILSLSLLKGVFIFLERGRWAGGIPVSMNVKCPSSPFIFFVKKM